MQHLIVDFDIIDFPMKKDSSGQMVVDTYAPKTMIWRSVIMVALMLFMTPLALLKNLSALRYFSMGNLCVLFYIIFTTLWQSPKFMEKFKNDPDYQVSYVASAPTMNWLSGFSTIVLSYMCHPNFFYIR